MNNFGKLTTQQTLQSLPVTTNIATQFPQLAEGEKFVKPINVGLPPGITKPTAETPTTTSASFITKYKMPLIIGAIAVGYMLFKKK